MTCMQKLRWTPADTKMGWTMLPAKRPALPTS
nr:MAG TPA: hypothetical protein [Caudoviricetes sp.]DAS04281.1 MAG TPA: hypothetical protein [Caudoviricetes sp.]DAV59680.1 MAG TPA: hypothetical protein [Caudoviricetes sp.]DAY49706.1 MAG TPA: hypothetical protein [Caudoviricetes sp.]